jgi:hypothetical protein
MTFIPPHLGQRQDCEEFLVPEGCNSTCGCGAAPRVSSTSVMSMGIGQSAVTMGDSDWKTRVAKRTLTYYPQGNSAADL